jgi:hypothetical protein
MGQSIKKGFAHLLINKSSLGVWEWPGDSTSGDGEAVEGLS